MRAATRRNPREGSSKFAVGAAALREGEKYQKKHHPTRHPGDLLPRVHTRLADSPTILTTGPFGSCKTPTAELSRLAL